MPVQNINYDELSSSSALFQDRPLCPKMFLLQITQKFYIYVFWTVHGLCNKNK